MTAVKSNALQELQVEITHRILRLVFGRSVRHGLILIAVLIITGELRKKTEEYGEKAALLYMYIHVMVMTSLGTRCAALQLHMIMM